MYFCFFFFFNDTATTEIYTVRNTLSLHDALPILVLVVGPQRKIGLLDGPSQRPSKLIYVRAVSPIVSNREAPLLGRIESTPTAKINRAVPGRLGQRQYRRSDADAHAIQTHQNL